MEKPQGKQVGQKTGGDSLLRQKLAEGLVLSDTEHDLAMQVHKYSSQETTANPEGVSYAEMIPSSLGPGYRRETNTRHTPSLSTHLPPTVYTSPTPAPPSQLGPFQCKAMPQPWFPTVLRADKPTDPMAAKAGSSCRSKGKSIRKLVLKRAVMVTIGWKGQGLRWEHHRNAPRRNQGHRF